MGREIPCNEVKMIISQRTETEIQTSETGKLLEKHQLEETILQRRKQGLPGSRETKNPYELESKKKSTLVQNRRRQNNQRRGDEH